MVQEPNAHTRVVRYALLLGLVFALCAFALATCIGAYTVFANEPFFSFFGATAGMTLAAFVVGAGGLYLIAACLPQLWQRIEGANPIAPLALRWEKCSVLVAAAGLFVLWLPYTIVQYPMPFYYDTVTQLYQWQTSAPTYYDNLHTFVDASYIDHHPVFDTLLYGSFLSLGEMLGSQNVGLFLLALIHSAASAVSIAACVCYLDKLGVPKPLRLAGWLFMALFPPVPLWACTLVKDVTNAPFYVAFFIMYIEAFLSRGAAIRSGKSLILFTLFVILGILTKKTMLYVLVPSLIVLLVWCWQAAKKQILSVLLGAVLVCQIAVPVFVYPVIGGVYPGGTQESLGIFMQQFTLVIRENNDISEEELAAAKALYDVDYAVEGYERGTTDHVKNSTYPEAGRSQFANFMKAWFMVGMRHPVLYTKAVFMVNAGFFCPGVPMHNYWNHEPSSVWKWNFADADVNGELHLDVGRPGFLRPINDAFHATFDAFMDSSVGVVFFGRGIFGGWIPLMCIFLSLLVDKRWVVAWVPVILIMGTLLVGPTDQPRYLLPLLYTTPFIIGLATYSLCGNQKLGAQNMERKIINYHDSGELPAKTI